jgi:hypothetical protein
MSVALPKYKDAVVRDTLGKFPTAPFGWYMMAGYAYYQKQRPIISDECFTELETYIIANWDEIRHPSKTLFKREEVAKGSALVDFSKISYLLKTSAHGHIATVYVNVKPERLVPIPVTPKKITPASPSPQKDQAKHYFTTQIVIDRSLVDDVKTEELSAINDVVHKHEHSYFGGMNVWGTCSLRGQALARMMSCITDLQGMGVKVTRYTMSETLIDSAREDVWKILKR